METLDQKIARIDADKTLAAELAERYSETSETSGSAAATAESVKPTKSAKPRWPVPSRPVPSGPQWTPQDEAAVLTGDPKDDEALAQRLNRTVSSVSKRRRVLRARSEINSEQHPKREEAIEPESKPSEGRDAVPVDEAGGSSEANAQQSGPAAGRRSGARGGEDEQTRASAAEASGSLAQSPPAEPNDPAPQPDEAPDSGSIEYRQDSQNDIDAWADCADDQSELREAIAATTKIEPPTGASAQPATTPPLRLARDAELEAIAQHEAKHGVTKCPGPGSTELAELPSLQPTRRGWGGSKKWGRPES
jgi:hypothetical protein